MGRFLILVLFLLCAPFAFANEVVRISTGEWAPYISESIEHKGLLAQITTEAFAQKGITVGLHFFPWARATELSKSGEFQGTIAFAKIKDREPFYLFSAPLYVGRYALFHLKSRPLLWTTYADLKDVQMAATRGFGGMGDEFIKAERDGVIKVVRLTSDVQSFNMLLAGRVSAVPSDLEVGYVLLNKLYGKDAQLFTHSPHLIRSSEYRLVISKKVKDGARLIEAFNEGLKALQMSGRYDEILRSWYSGERYKAVPAQFLPAPRVGYASVKRSPGR